jgi:hypothetical protein
MEVSLGPSSGKLAASLNARTGEVNTLVSPLFKTGTRHICVYILAVGFVYYCNAVYSFVILLPIFKSTNQR